MRENQVRGISRDVVDLANRVDLTTSNLSAIQFAICGLMEQVDESIVEESNNVWVLKKFIKELEHGVRLLHMSINPVMDSLEETSKQLNEQSEMLHQILNKGESA